jgi:hypothetical protein
MPGNWKKRYRSSLESRFAASLFPNPNGVASPPPNLIQLLRGLIAKSPLPLLTGKPPRCYYVAIMHRGKILSGVQAAPRKSGNRKKHSISASELPAIDALLSPHNTPELLKRRSAHVAQSNAGRLPKADDALFAMLKDFEKCSF